MIIKAMYNVAKQNEIIILYMISNNVIHDSKTPSST